MAFLSRTARLVRGSAAAMLVASGLGGVLSAQAPPTSTRRADEYQLKAAIIYNLAKFVEWPAAAFPDAGAPLTICVLGTDPFGPALDAAMQGRFVAGRAVATRRITALEPGCHVVFVAASEARRLPIIFDQLRGRSVLSVGEDRAFLDQGGIVGLTTQGDRVQFAISGEAAEHAHLKVSARVLALAGASRSQGVRP